MAERLADAEIQERITSLNEWKLEKGELTRQFMFKDFGQAMAFINQVANLAEEANHHPNIDIRWNKVLLRLTTHSKGGLTSLDFDLAARIDSL